MERERTPLPLAEDSCTSCGNPSGEPHADECLLAEHDAMRAGDEAATAVHDSDSCYWCLSDQPPALSTCRCGKCCHLLIEVTLEDAKREPKIREHGSPIFAPAELTASGRRQLQGFLLNTPENGYACAFLDHSSGLCQIYATRPLICRLFNCDESDQREAADDACA